MAPGYREVSREDFRFPAGKDSVPGPADLGPGKPPCLLGFSPHHLEEELPRPITKEEGLAEPWGSWEGDPRLVALEGEEGKSPI